VRTLGISLLLSVTALAGGWPFDAGEGANMFRKRDLYNLGLLGIKAADAKAPAPERNEPPRGGRRSFQVQRASHDNGPDELRVVLLYPDGPADKAGIVPGDVIVGVRSSKFREGCLPAMHKALVKAEASKGEVVLLVRRSGEKKTLKIPVRIPVGGRAASKPTTGDGRKAIVDAALAWLAQRQEPDGGFRQTLSGTNGAVVMTACAGLAWLGGGSDLKSGPYSDNVRRATEFIRANLDRMGTVASPRATGGASWNQCNWGLAYGAIFFGELHARSPERGVLATLHTCAERLVEYQEESGGWAHGPGGPNALGYVELNIVTGLALGGLGLAAQSGFEVGKDCLERAEKYLRDSGGGDGGVGYSTKPGQKGSGNIGRSAGAWLGYLALGKGKSGWGKKMGGYVKRHVGEVLGGHASLMQHIQLAGVAAHAAGNGAIREFWKSCERDLVLARAPDGSLQPRPWHESLSMSSNSDVTFGEVWTTAAWAMVLTAETPKDKSRGFPAWFGRR
jgi:hypothetical protein